MAKRDINSAKRQKDVPSLHFSLLRIHRRADSCCRPALTKEWQKIQLDLMILFMKVISYFK